jgi:hypothetical protein
VLAALTAKNFAVETESDFGEVESETSSRIKECKSRVFDSGSEK